MTEDEKELKEMQGIIAAMALAKCSSHRIVNGVAQTVIELWRIKASAFECGLVISDDELKDCFFSDYVQFVLFRGKVEYETEKPADDDEIEYLKVANSIPLDNHQ